MLAPVLARLYSPADFGVLGVISSIVAVSVVAASLSYEVAIPLPQSKNDALSLVYLCCLLLTASALIALAVVALLGKTLATALNIAAWGDLLWFVPVGILAAGAYRTLNYLALRSKGFGTIAATKLLQTTGGGAVQLAGGVAGVGAPGLVFGHILAQSLGVGLLWSKNRFSLRPVLVGAAWKDLVAAALAHRDFPRYALWSSLMNSASLQMPILLLASFFGSATAGQYQLGLQALQLPLALLGASVAQVFYADAANHLRDGILHQQTRGTLVLLARWSLAIVPSVAIAAPHLVSLFFGHRWREAGEYLQYLTPWLLLVFVASPLSSVPRVLGRQRGEMLFQLLLLAARAAALLIGGHWLSARHTIILFAATSAIAWLAYTLWLCNLVRIPWRMLSLDLRPSLSLAAASSALLLLVQIAFSQSPLEPIVVSGLGACAIGLGIYFLVFGSAIRSRSQPA